MATVHKSKHKHVFGLPPLPMTAVTHDGFKFRTDGDAWSLQGHTKKICLKFSQCVGTSPAFLHSFKQVLLWYFANKSVSHASNIFGRIVQLIRFVNSQHGGMIEHFSTAHILNYRASLSKKHEYQLGAIVCALEKWHELGYPGIDEEVISLFKQLHLSGNTKGEAVQTMDPIKGPFSDIEFEAIHSAANRAYAEGLLELKEYVLLWLYCAIGARPVQYASLKVKDFSKITDDQGTIIYILKVPRAKQRNALARSDFTERKLISQIGELVEKHIEAIFDSHSGFTADARELPLFPQRENSNNIPGFSYHVTSMDITNRLKAAIAKLNVVSERTGERIKINSRRFRYTLGTRASAEGAGELVIAELLDHSDTQNVGIYVESRPEIVERIDKAMALYLAPMAQAFCGILVENEIQASPGDDTLSRIIDPKADPMMHPVGNCGKHGFCGFAAPIACYTCSNFRPWLDGPHEAVLESLLQERDDIQVKGVDLRIASVNDRTILAVAEVVRRCNEMKTAQEVA